MSQFYLKSAEQEVLECQEVTVIQGAKDLFSSIKQVWNDVNIYLISVGMNYFITLMVYPVVVQQTISSCDSDSWYCEAMSKYFCLIFCFLLYNVMDWTSRVLAGSFQIFKPDDMKLIFFVTLFRLIPVALLFFTKRDDYSGYSILGTDAAFIVLIIILGLTNGYLATTISLFIPMKVKNEHRSIASMLIPFFMCSGLVAGAGISFLSTYLVTKIG